MGRWLAVRAAARGLRGGIGDDEMERLLRARFPHRDGAWRWEIIGDAHPSQRPQAGQAGSPGMAERPGACLMPPKCKLCHQYAGLSDLASHGPGCRAPLFYLLLLAYARAYA